MQYYLDKHVPLVWARCKPLGLVQIELEESLVGGASDAPAAFTIIGRMFFPSVEDLQNALATHGPELIGDIANFTNVQPLMQVSQKVSASVPA